MDTNSSKVEVYLSGLHWPVTTLGHGRRIGIWLQGCSIRCKGCCSRDTWDQVPGQATTVDTVLEWVNRQPLERADGFTISGGEPFDQPHALACLLRGLADLRLRDAKPRDVLVYSGYPWPRLVQRHAELLEQIDTVISEPFVQGKPASGLRGSSNQIIHALTALGEARHGADAPKTADQMQMHYDGERLWLVGIPRPGSLDALAARLAAAGISMDDCSWRP